MSEVLNFFKEHPSMDEPLHRALREIPALKARLQDLRAQALACCGAEEVEGKVELAVIDEPRWKAIAAEQAAISSRLAALDALVAELDKLFAAAEKEGFRIFRKTPAGLRAAEVQWRAEHRIAADAYSNEGSRGAGNAHLADLATKAEALQAEVLGI